MNKIYFLIDNNYPLSVYEEDFILSNLSNIIFVSNNIYDSKQYCKTVFKIKDQIIDYNDFGKLIKPNVLMNDAFNYVVNNENLSITNFNVINKDVYYKEIYNFITNEKLLLNTNIINPKLFKKIQNGYNKHSRFLHALNVSFLSYKIAYNYLKKEDLKSIILAGLIHDITKDYDYSLQLSLAKNNKYFSKFNRGNDYSLHQFASAVVYEKIIKKYDTFNLDIYDAISFHCTGKANMNLFSKILFYSDKYECSRYLSNKEKSVKIIDSIFRSIKNFDSEFHNFIEDQINYFKNKNIDYLSDSNAKEFYEFELKK